MGKANAMGGAANIILNTMCYSVVFALFHVHPKTALKVHGLGVGRVSNVVASNGSLFGGRDHNSSRSSKYFGVPPCSFRNTVK